LLSCSIATLIRLEAMNVLRPVKLNPTSPSACVFYRRDDLVVLASGGGR
jgi:hypothetical protein